MVRFGLDLETDLAARSKLILQQMTEAQKHSETSLKQKNVDKLNKKLNLQSIISFINAL